MSVEGAAIAVVTRFCDSRYDGVGVVYSDSAVLSAIPKRRAATREKEQQRLNNVVREVVEHLREGGSAESAREIARSAGLADSIDVSEGYEGLVRAVAGRFEAGDNAWCETLATTRLLALYFWHDPNHGRVLAR
jgi:hypothetical protein